MAKFRRRFKKRYKSRGKSKRQFIKMSRGGIRL